MSIAIVYLSFCFGVFFLILGIVGFIICDFIKNDKFKKIVKVIWIIAFVFIIIFTIALLWPAPKDAKNEWKEITNN